MGQRQGDGEGGAFANLGGKGDLAAHFFDELFADEQTQSGTGDAFGGFFFDPKEAGKDLLLVFGRDTDAFVFDVSV